MGQPSEGSEPAPLPSLHRRTPQVYMHPSPPNPHHTIYSLPRNHLQSLTRFEFHTFSTKLITNI